MSLHALWAAAGKTLLGGSRLLLEQGGAKMAYCLSRAQDPLPSYMWPEKAETRNQVNEEMDVALAIGDRASKATEIFLGNTYLWQATRS